MLINEVYVNVTEGYLCGESGEYEPYTDNLGKLFRSLQKELGRCISKIYIGEGVPIGWVFQKRQKYTDCNKTYISETWVELLEKPSMVTKEKFPLSIGGVQ